MDVHYTQIVIVTQGKGGAFHNRRAAGSNLARDSVVSLTKTHSPAQTIQLLNRVLAMPGSLQK